MTEDEWMHHNPRVIQHGQKRRRPLDLADVTVITIAVVIVTGGILAAVLPPIIRAVHG